MDQPMPGDVPPSSASSSFSEFLKRVDHQTLIARLKGFVENAAETWQQIKAEAATERDIVEKYLAAMIVVPLLCTFIGVSLLGGGSIGGGLKLFVFGLVAQSLGILIGVLLTQFLSNQFGGSNNRVDALKWVTFASLPGAAARLLDIVQFLPIIGYLVTLVQLLAALFGIYVAWVGIPIALGVPTEKRIMFFAALIGCAIVAALILTPLLGAGAFISGATH